VPQANEKLFERSEFFSFSEMKLISSDFILSLDFLVLLRQGKRTRPPGDRGQKEQQTKK
jgi:hypothetical protein